jgi:hypothetical protein
MAFGFSVRQFAGSASSVLPLTSCIDDVSITRVSGP